MSSRPGLQIQPSLATIRGAQKFLAKYFAPTRLVPAPFLSGRTGKNVYLKLETELPTGSCKVRGAFCAGAKKEAGNGAGSGGFEHGKSRGGGGVCGERVWHCGKDLFACELQSGEAREDRATGSGDCGVRGQRLGIRVPIGGGICETAGGLFPE